MSQPTILVCALADAPRAVPGSIFHLRCTVCARSVMVAPSGQRVLTEMPRTKIVCGPCYEACSAPGDTVQGAGTIGELRKEVRAARPNLRRHRN